MAEVRFGSSPDFSKDRGMGSRLKEQFEKRFMFNAAKKEWMEKHQGRIENFKRIESQLTPDQRKKVVDKLNRDANIGAAWKVGKNVLGLTTMLGAVLMGGRMVFDSTFRMDVGKQLKTLRGMSPREMLSSASTHAQEIFGRVKTRAETLVDDIKIIGHDALESISGKNKK